MNESSGDADDAVITFTVYCEEPRKKFKVSLKARDIAKLRVLNIKRKLEKVSTVAADQQILSLGERVFRDDESGAAIGLYTNCTLVLQRKPAAEPQNPPPPVTLSSSSSSTTTTHSSSPNTNPTTTTARSSYARSPPPPIQVPHHDDHPPSPSPPRPTTTVSQPPPAAIPPPPKRAPPPPATAHHSTSFTSNASSSSVPAMMDSFLLRLDGHSAPSHPINTSSSEPQNHQPSPPPSATTIASSSSTTTTTNTTNPPPPPPPIAMTTTTGSQNANQQPMMIVQKLHEQMAQRATLEAEVRRLQDELAASRAACEQMVRDRESALARQWESEKAALLASVTDSSVSAALGRAQADWDKDRSVLMSHWNQETELLTTIWKEEKAEWAHEKSALYDKHQRECALLRDELQRLHADETARLQQRVAEAERQRAHLAESEAALRVEAEHAATLARSARLAMDELRGTLAERWGAIVGEGRMPPAERAKLVAFVEATAGDMGIDTRQLSASGSGAATAEAQRVASYVVACAMRKAHFEDRIGILERENAQMQARLRDENARRRALHNALEEAKGNIRVLVRIRPPRALSGAGHIMTHQQHASGTQELAADPEHGVVRVSSVALGTRAFSFYGVLPDSASQDAVYAEIAPLVTSALDGYPVCIFAYGQTGSGKTFTMYGDETLGGASLYAPGRGLVPRTIEDVFQRLSDSAHVSVVHCSMAELYCDQVRDMLADLAPQTPITGHQLQKSSVATSSGALLSGLTVHFARSAQDVLALMAQGLARRQVHATAQNPASSRSHLLFFVTVEFELAATRAKLTSKLCFIDLAGSERIHKSHSQGERFREAQHINKSLSALGDVVAALSEKAAFVPYRNSKLTLLLQDVLGGSAKTVMLANVSPDASDVQESLSTLSFAARVRKVRNAPTARSIALPSSNAHAADEQQHQQQQQQQQSSEDMDEYSGNENLVPSEAAEVRPTQWQRTPIAAQTGRPSSTPARTNASNMNLSNSGGSRTVTPRSRSAAKKQ